MRKIYCAAAVLAAACLALTIFGQRGENGADMLYALALPFVWAGLGLRSLSLSGALGNAAAIALYAAVSLLPLIPYGKAFRRKGKVPAGWLLVSMCAYLFFLMYYMINPTMIQGLFYGGIPSALSLMDVQQAMLCLVFYMLLASYWVLSIMVDIGNHVRHLKSLLFVFGAGLIIFVFYLNAAVLKQALSPIVQPSGLDVFRSGNPEGKPATLDGLIAVIFFFSGSAPALVMLTVIPLAFKLLNSLESDLFSAQNQQRAAAIAARCRLVVYISLGGMMIATALQLLLGPRLTNVNITGQIPLSMLALSLGMMLLAGYLARSCAVKQENEMMI